MSVTVHDVEQRSDEWFRLRLGRLTSSRAADMTAVIAKGEAAARRNLRVDLVLERITGRSQERNFQSGPMKDGIEREPFAVARYDAMTGNSVWPVGFISHDEYMAGCSPDGLIGEHGSVSIKCPTPAIHWEYLKSGVVPKDYMQQIRHEFWLTGRSWCDFFSFNPDFPEPLQAKLIRVYRKLDEIEEYEMKALAFLLEVDNEVNAVRTMADLGAALKAS